MCRFGAREKVQRGQNRTEITGCCSVQFSGKKGHFSLSSSFNEWKSRQSKAAHSHSNSAEKIRKVCAILQKLAPKTNTNFEQTFFTKNPLHWSLHLTVWSLSLSFSVPCGHYGSQVNHFRATEKQKPINEQSSEEKNLQ